MKYALIGKNISHSRSPAIYKKIMGHDVDYSLLDISDASELPSIEALAKIYLGINITSPYKTHYLDQVSIQDIAVKKLGSINTIKFKNGLAVATNTDLIAVRSILKNFKNKYPSLHLLLLGSGVMAKLTMIVAQELKLSVSQLDRQQFPDLATMDLRNKEKMGVQNLVINACSRDFFFQGQQSKENIFWDYNYSFIPHQNTLPFLIKEYHDGQEMLFLQAIAAKEFWSNNKN